ncbi:MAG: hypothetical protein L3J37_09530 [Rhodobacteraceae bacterium]|nr:hypothetical protein [Paracoccaceae bacterium]
MTALPHLHPTDERPVANIPRRLTLVDALLFSATFFLLTSIYVTVISEIWGYAGFEREVSILKTTVSYLLLFGILQQIPRRFSTRSFLLVMIFYIYLVPAYILFAVGGASLLFILVVSLAYLLIFMASWVKVKRVKVGKLSGKSLLALVLGLSMLTVLVTAVYSGFSTFNLNLMKVYDFRSDAAAKLPAIFGYITSPVGKILLPAGVVLSLYYGRTRTALLFVVITVLYFGFAQHKSILFAPLMVYLLYIGIKRTKSLAPIHILLFLIALSGLAELMYNQISGGQNYFFNGLFIRRLFFVPPLIDTMYLEFFSSNPLLLWSQSKVSFGMVASPYELQAPFLIGQEFFGNAEMSANTGIIGSGFSNASLIGVTFYAILLGLVIAFLNVQGQILGHALVASISLTIVLSIMNSSDFVTAFLTHGLLWLLILLLLMPRQDNQGLGDLK